MRRNLERNQKLEAMSKKIIQGESNGKSSVDGKIKVIRKKKEIFEKYTKNKQTKNKTKSQPPQQKTPKQPY